MTLSFWGRTDLIRNSKRKDATFDNCNESCGYQAAETGELKEKHTNFPKVNSQSALQTTESCHRNSGRESQTGRAGRVGVGAYRERRGFKEETLASERQVEGEKKILQVLNHPF